MTTGALIVPTASSSRWRPMQGAAHLIALVIGGRGLLLGPVPGEPVYIVTGGHTLLTYIWYSSLIIGAITAMVGEIIQLRIPFLTRSVKQLEDFVTGLIIERCGTGLLTASFLGYAGAILFAPNILPTRALVYIIIGLGFLGRTCQTHLNRRRVKHDLEAAARYN